MTNRQQMGCLYAPVCQPAWRPMQAFLYKMASPFHTNKQTNIRTYKTFYLFLWK